MSSLSSIADLVRFGPRALGHRSLLAVPDSALMRDRDLIHWAVGGLFDSQRLTLSLPLNRNTMEHPYLS